MVHSSKPLRRRMAAVLAGASVALASGQALAANLLVEGQSAVNINFSIGFPGEPSFYRMLFFDLPLSMTDLGPDEDYLVSLFDGGGNFVSTTLFFGSLTRATPTFDFANRLPGGDYNAVVSAVGASSFLFDSNYNVLTKVGGQISDPAFEGIPGGGRRIVGFAGRGSVTGITLSPGPGGGGPNTAVPETATWAMMILGFGAAGAMLRRRARQTA